LLRQTTFLKIYEGLNQSIRIASNAIIDYSIKTSGVKRYCKWKKNESDSTYEQERTYRRVEKI
jgi:hypothetical protein